jgi:hypothetical protein
MIEMDQRSARDRFGFALSKIPTFAAKDAAKMGHPKIFALFRGRGAGPAPPAFH